MRHVQVHHTKKTKTTWTPSELKTEPSCQENWLLARRIYCILYTHDFLFLFVQSKSENLWRSGKTLRENSASSATLWLRCYCTKKENQLGWFFTFWLRIETISTLLRHGRRVTKRTKSWVKLTSKPIVATHQPPTGRTSIYRGDNKKNFTPI